MRIVHHRFAAAILALSLLPVPAWSAEPTKAEPDASRKVLANGESQLVKNLKAGKAQTIVTYGTSLTSGGAWVRQLDAAPVSNTHLTLPTTPYV